MNENILFTSTTKHDLVSEMYHNRKLKQASVNLIKNKGTALHEDLLSELYLHILEIPDVKFNHLITNKYVYFYCVKFMSVCMNPSSTFYTKHKGKEIHFDFVPEYITTETSDLTCFEIMEENNVRKQIQDYINSLYWYDKVIYELYVHKSQVGKRKFSANQVARLTKIPASEIHIVVNRVKEQIDKFILEKQLLND